MAGRLRRIIKIIGFAGLALFSVVQLVPYGRDHTNPPPTSEPTWDKPSTRALAARVCFDCHSNETRWPWYSHVAPASWLVQRDVDVGRRTMNFSEWDRPYAEAHESAEAVLEAEMPPAIYLLPRPSVRLSAEEKRVLANGLTATLGSKTEERDHD